MEFKGIKKVHEGRFITRYDVEYETKDGQTKIYEIISRNKNLQTLEDLNNPVADSVILILTDEKDQKILVSKEYRMAMGRWIYNFPAGLIDPGESVIEAAARELKEETGLDLVEVEDIVDHSYSAIGFSNERNVCLMGKASGTIKPSNSSLEEIEANWYTRAEVRKLLKTEYFAARTQAYLYLWSKETFDLVGLARQIATKAHAGQKDKAGLDYINHPEYVASLIDDDELKAAALLHDVLEDTDTTAEDLLEAGIPASVVEIVETLTHRDDESYADYINRISKNPKATKVKLADLKHNSDLSRIPNPTMEDVLRREKYLRYMEMLQGIEVLDE